MLMFLPVLSVLTFCTSVLLIGAAMFAGDQAGIPKPFLLPGFFALLLAITFVGVFFNAALVSCVLDAFAGRPVSLRAGLAAAMARLPQIFRWALHATTIGFFISLLQGMLRKLGILGVLLGNAAPLSWAILTYFVVPVLVTENVGPRRSGQAFHGYSSRKTGAMRSAWKRAFPFDCFCARAAHFVDRLCQFRCDVAVGSRRHACRGGSGRLCLFRHVDRIRVYHGRHLPHRRLYIQPRVPRHGVDPAAMKTVFRASGFSRFFRRSFSYCYLASWAPLSRDLGEAAASAAPAMSFCRALPAEPAGPENSCSAG